MFKKMREEYNLNRHLNIAYEEYKQENENYNNLTDNEKLQEEIKHKREIIINLTIENKELKEQLFIYTHQSLSALPVDHHKNDYVIKQRISTFGAKNALLCVSALTMNLLKDYIRCMDNKTFKEIPIIGKLCSYTSVNCELIKECIKHKADTNLEYNGKTPIEYLVLKKENDDLIQIFINKKCLYNFEILQNACEKNHINLVKYCLDHNIEKCEIKNYYSNEIKELLLTC